MKNLLTFEKFINESKLNEAAPNTLNGQEDSFDSTELVEWIISVLGAKNAKEVCILDEDEPTDPKAYTNISRKVTDWVENEEFTDYDVWYYSTKHNVIKCDSDGYIVYYCLVKDLKKF